MNRWLGEDPDYARRDLYEAVENGQRPSWALYVQVITAQEIDNSFTYNPFDPTKVMLVFFLLIYVNHSIVL